MADSYRGLTIRIGGDTTKLSQALKSANQAAAGTESVLRKLSQALKMDPSSLKASQLQVGAMAEQASITAGRVATLNSALKEVGERIPDGASKSIKEIADSTGNVHTKVAQTRKKYQELTEALAENYQQLTKLHNKAAEAVGKDLVKDWDIGTSFSEMRKELDALPEGFKKTDKEIAEFKRNLESIQVEYKKLQYERESLIGEFNKSRSPTKRDKISFDIEGLDVQIENAEAKFEKLIEKFQKLKGNTFRFEDDTTDFDVLVQALNEIATAGTASDDTLVKLYDTVAHLKGEFVETKETLSLDKEVAEFTDLEAEAAKAEARMESVVSQIVEANKTSDTSKGIAGLSRELADIDKNGKTARDSLKAIIESMKSSGGSEEKMTAAIRAYQESVDSARAKSANLQKQIAAYKNDEVIKLAKSMESLHERTTVATKAFENATRSQQTYQAMIDKVNERIDELRVKHEDFEGMAEYKDLIQQAKLLSDGMERAGESTDRARANMQKFVEAGELRGKYQELIQVDSVLEAMARINLDPATATIKDLEKALDVLSDKPATPKIDQAAFMQSVQMVSQAVRRMTSEIISASNEIDTAFRDMRKTVNGTEEQYNQLRDAAIEYSKTHFTSADTMLEMQALGGQLGVLIDDLGQFGTIASNLTIASDIGAEDAALQLGQLSNVMQLDIDGMQGFSDALVRLGNNMPAQESRIMNVAQRFAAVASTANFSGDEILAWSAAIASTGQRSEAAATAIGNTVSGIEQAIANGGSDLDQFAAIASMSADEFVSAWQSDPTQALKAFIEGLHTLTESDESAVAALENMGITGVRQQQTLLGLSQTIGSLDNALIMSRNAWNQVSDQWGDAGDAANEAQKKAEGFSGHLAMMKNNAQNLAASFGDTLVPMLDAATKVLGTLTDVMNSIPGPLKTLIVLGGGAAVAFGTIVPVIQQFAGGIAALNAAGGLAGLIAKLAGTATAAEGAAASAGALGTTLGGPVAIGIAAVVVAGTALLTMCNDMQQKQETLRQATDGLVESVNGAVTGYENYESTMGKVAASADELTEKQATLAGSITQRWEEVGASAAMVDELVGKISELTSAGELNVQQQGELVTAVRTYNDLTGENVEILDRQKGVLSETNSEIQANADAWKNAAESEAAYESYKEVFKERMENQIALNQKQAEYEEALKTAQSLESGWFNDMRNSSEATGSASAALGEMSEEIRRIEGLIESNDAALAEYSGMMDATNSTITEMRTALVDAGESTEDFESLTDEELMLIAYKWGTTVDAILAGIAEIKKANADASGMADDLARSSKAANKQAAKELKAELDAEYKELKRSLDASYKEAQRARDAEYKARQRDLDKQYKQAQKYYDSIYKAAQKAYDAEYKQAQKAYDKEYKEFQKTLDAEYKALQKSLDSEYKARKKQYDDALKLLKKQQDGEVDAFKKATDAKLKEMEREYKQKLKMLELEYGQQDSGLDDQIKQLKAETEAEKKAIEERNQNEKVAELQKSVDQAKTRRTRAEAEKALNDYLQELDQKRNEDSREAEMERLKERQDALKEELDQRKEELKAQYDADVEAYKAKREAELEAMKEANTVEYEAKKEYYDLQLEQMKEAQTVQLEAVKEDQALQLESLKEAQTLQLESLKEAQTANLEALKESQQEQLENMKLAQQDELDALKQKHQDELDAIKQHNQDTLDEKKADNARRVEERKKGNAEEEEEDKRSADARKSLEKESDDDRLIHLAMFKQSALDKTKSGNNDIENEEGESLRKRLDIVNNYNGEAISALDRFKSDAARSAEETSSEYNNGISAGFDDAQISISNAVMRMHDTLMEQDWYSSGWDMMANFVNGIIDNFNESGYPGLWSIAEWMASVFQHSTPKRGPLKDDDKWFVHLGENLINGLKSKEGELYRQVDKMARTMEEGFDPDLSVNAALDAVSSINRGRKADAIAIANESKSVSIEVNVDLSNVSIRNDEDIERLATEISQRMAAQVRRQQAGRL